MTDIPKARDKIEKALKILNAENFLARRHKGEVNLAQLEIAILLLTEALPLMTRLILKDPAPPRRGPLTKEEKLEIRAYVERHPEECFDDIARRYNCAGGRISEALREL